MSTERTYAIGDRVVFLTTMPPNDQVHTGGHTNFNDRRLPLIIEGTVSQAWTEDSENYISIVHGLYDNRPNATIRGSSASEPWTSHLALTARGMRDRIAYIGSPTRRFNEAQKEILNKVMFPVVVASGEYIRMLKDIAAASGNANYNGSLEDAEQILSAAESAGLPVLRRTESANTRIGWHPEQVASVVQMNPANQTGHGEPEEGDDW